MVLLRNIIDTEREQDADCARIEAAIRFAEQEIAALDDGRQLDPDDKRRKWSGILDRTITIIRDVRRNIAKRASDAKETQAWAIERFFRERAIRERDDVVHDLAAIVQDIPTNKLLDHLRYFVRIGDVTRVQGVRVAFEAREDRYPYVDTFNGILAQFALAESGDDLGERVARICQAAEQADARIAGLFLRSPRAGPQ